MELKKSEIEIRTMILRLCEMIMQHKVKESQVKDIIDTLYWVLGENSYLDTIISEEVSQC